VLLVSANSFFQEKVCSSILDSPHKKKWWILKKKCKTHFGGVVRCRKATLCCRMLTYADVCGRMLKDADSGVGEDVAKQQQRNMTSYTTVGFPVIKKM